MKDQSQEFMSRPEAEAKIAREQADAKAIASAEDAMRAFKASLLPRARKALEELMGDADLGMSKFRIFLAIESRLMVAPAHIWRTLNHFSPAELVSIWSGRKVTALCDEMTSDDVAMAGSLGRRPRITDGGANE